MAHNAEGKVVFIEGALPGERVRVQVHRRKNQWEQASLASSRARVRSGCARHAAHFGVCGGCKMQHLHVGAQVATKQRALEDALWHLGKVKAERVLRPIEGPAWGYRYRARLSVRHVVKKGKVLIGFHERKSSYVADMDSCEVLPPHLSAMLLPLRELIAAMEQRDRLPQIEVAIGDAVTALVLRHLEPLSEADLRRLREFGRAHGVQWWLQPKGPDTVHRLDEGGPPLAYTLPEFGIDDAVQADRFHAGQPRDQPRAGRPCAAPARRAAPGARDRLVLRPRQFHAADRAAARRCWVSRAARRWWSARVTMRCSTARRTDALRRAQSVRTHRRRSDGSAVRQMAGRSAARGCVRAGQGAGRLPRQVPARRGSAAAAHRLRQLQSGHAGARRRPAGAPGRLPLHGGRRGQHVSAHRARREHRGVRPRSPKAT